MYTLEEGGMRFWNLQFDPFSESPLCFEDYRDYDFLVKTSNINLMANICAQLSNDYVSKTFFLLGDRGSGKSSALRYLDSLLNEKSNVNDISVYCNVLSLNDGGHDQIRDTLHKTLLDSLLEKVDTSDKLRQSIDALSISDKVLYSNDLFAVDREIKRVLGKISHYYDRIFIFVDNLDKSDAYRAFENYFKVNQGFYEEIKKRKTFLFIAMKPFIGERLRKSHETGFLDQKTFTMKGWSPDELNLLVSRRLQCAYSGYDFHLGKFFESDALNVIYERNRHLPRYVISSCRRLLERAYQSSKQERVEIPCKPIKKVFLRIHKDCIRGYRHGYDDFGIVDSLVLENHPKAYELIEKCFRSNESMAYELTEALFSVRENGTFHDKEVLQTLERMNIIQSITAQKKRRYQLVPLVDNLIHYLVNSMEDDIESAKYYLMSNLT